MKNRLSKLGPGLLFAGAAIGVSHLVQSTRAGADFGWGLLWALILVNLFKYPFFQYGPRFANATNKSLLDGYLNLGKGFLRIYFLLNIGTMFTIQTAVTIVTAGLASQIFGISDNLVYWSVAITLLCTLILWLGKYATLDRIVKWIILTLTISTVIAVCLASFKNTNTIDFVQILPSEANILFLIAFMGWMPAPMDISIWHSLWAIEKNKELHKNSTMKESLFDFNVGYWVTLILGICFMGLGAFVMFGSGIEFSGQGGTFAAQLINLYTATLGDGFYIIIAIAALTTMFSTTITTLDASPRVMSKTIELLYPNRNKKDYKTWLLILAVGTIFILMFLLSEMGILIQIATVLSFITAPFYAFLNFKLVLSDQMPEEHKPNKSLKILSVLGIIFLTSFAISYLLML
ncbi:divalent metal cation transporter [Flavobacteriaceae bacterium]|uniref:NRAMP family divalent metal transporter n=1 Tax=Candidatus Arcticimaribacter forsetii TaxID=2820661 RepID=UPI002076E478|nr:divalent metal cation transporter [Candidatus Arcticimaribacter forsetii]MDA8698894.1 divalent metal cation transporter [Flavobacteriaceae bacterium]MDB2326103.1 divalent metal cation transporter [Flavobacteriaceae bacterium]